MLMKNKKYCNGEKLILVLTAVLLSTFSIGRMNLYGNYIMIAITLAVIVIYVANNSGLLPYFIRKFHLYVGLFAAYCIMTSVWAINSKYAIEKGTTIFEILICTSIFYWIFNTFDNRVEKILKVIMYSGYIVMTYSFFSSGFLYVLRVLISGGRLDSSFDNVNMISFVCAISIIINLYFVMYDRVHIKDCILLIPTVVMVLACGSRKSLLILVLGIMLIYLFKIKSEGMTLKGIKYVLFLCLTILLFVIATTSAYLSGIMGRMDGLIALITGNGRVDHSALLRQQMVELGISIFKHNPIGGIGIGCPRILTYSTFGTNSYLHNNYAELLAGGGIFGFLLYYLPFMRVFLSLWKARKAKLNNESHVILVLYLCMFIADYGMVSYYSKLHYFLLLAGFMCVEYITERELLLFQDE